jgi:hypothetical protein
MARPRRLAPAALTACRLEYETTAATIRDLGLKYGVGKSALSERACLDGWLRLNPLAPKCRRRARAEIAGGVEVTNRIQGTRCALAEGPFPDKCPPGEAGEATGKISCDRPERPDTGEFSCKELNPKLGQTACTVIPVKTSGQGSVPTPLRSTGVVPIPDDTLQDATPEKAQPPGVLLPRRRQNDTGLLYELAARYDLLTAQQVAHLDRHQRLLDDFRHLIELCIAPEECLDLDALPEAEREGHVARIRRTALSLLFPTERDTLANAIRTLTAAMAVTVQLQRLITGSIALKGRGKEPAPCDRPDLSSLDTPALVRVRESMQLLRGDRERRSPPPVPAAPESIEDFRPATHADQAEVASSSSG